MGFLQAHLGVRRASAIVSTKYCFPIEMALTAGIDIDVLKEIRGSLAILLAEPYVRLLDVLESSGPQIRNLLIFHCLTNKPCVLRT